jgi:exonuclease SbcD
VDCQPGQQAEVQEIYLTSGCPLVRWQAKDGIAEAIKLCEGQQDSNAWIDLTVHVPEPLKAEEIKQLRELRPKIINIRPVLPEMEATMQLEGRDRLPVDQLFHQFYQHHHGVPPNEELVKLFLELLQQEKDGEGA